MPGKLEILNTGDGHTEIVVDRSNPIELERASRIIEDMLKRGYALFVHGKNNVLTRVKRFDKKHKAYIIGAEATVPAEATPVGRKKWKEAAVPIESAKVTVVGRSAGG